MFGYLLQVYITSSTMILAISDFADELDGRFQDAAACLSKAPKLEIQSAPS